MDSSDNLRGSEANPGGAMADQIAALQLQVAQLTQMLQSGVKMEAVSGVERQSVKDALGSLGENYLTKPSQCSIPRLRCNNSRRKERCCS